jgi:hypothetical protein
MDLVQGKDISSYNRSNYPEIKKNLEDFSKDCNFIRGEANLQLQDVLTGQMDRHSGNVMVITGNDGKIHIIGIDNDLSFPISADEDPGVANKVPTTLTDEDRRKDTSRNFCMPPVIDTDMQKFVTDLDLNELKKMYEERSLTKKEIDPAIERAKLVKEHVAKMPPDRIIKPDEWATSKAVGDYCNADNFYARRHADRNSSI